jgi:hypothetical protein
MNTMGGSTDSGDDQVVGTKAGKSAVQATPTDLDTFAQQRSSIKAAPEPPKKYGNNATLGRSRQK